MWKLTALLLFVPVLTWADGITLRPISTGRFKTSYSNLIEGGRREAVSIPIPVYLIQHPQGIVLFDSGLGSRFDDEVGGWWFNQLLQLPLPYHRNRSDTAVEQLKGFGISPDAVSTIVLSHLHLDHAGGLRDFPNAQVIVSRAEWESAQVDRWHARLRGIMKEQLEGVKIWPLDYQAGTAVGPFQASFDLFGDGSVLILSTPGHTPGHQSLLVTLGSGKKVLLTGDAIWVGDGYKKPAPKGWLVRTLEEDVDLAWQTTLAIHRFHVENPDCLIIPGHDPDLWLSLPELLQ